MTTLPTHARNVRAILIQQQDRAPKVELALPTILRNPFLLILWMLVLSTAAAALLLGRVRIPHTAHGLVVAAPSPTRADSLTPVLLLPAWSRNLVHSGVLASVDTGGTDRLTVTIASIDPSPLTLASARHWLDVPNASISTIDTTLVVARLLACTRQPCPKIAPGTRYTAIARLGTRSLASFAIPST
jgi:hypothetical protein